MTSDIAQRHRAFEADLDDLVQRQQRIGSAVSLQSVAWHVLHHQVGLMRVGHCVEDPHHVRVLQLAGQVGFGGKEPLAVVLVQTVTHAGFAHPFDRDLALAEFILGQKNLAGGAFAQSPDHPVLADALRQTGIDRPAPVQADEPRRERRGGSGGKDRVGGHGGHRRSSRVVGSSAVRLNAGGQAVLRAELASDPKP